MAGVVLLALGTVINPTLTTLIVLLDLASPRFAAEAFGWSSTSIAVGSGAGAALAGALAQNHGAGTALAVAAACVRWRCSSQRLRLACAGLASRPVPGKVRGAWAPERKRASFSAIPSARS